MHRHHHHTWHGHATRSSAVAYLPTNSFWWLSPSVSRENTQTSGLGLICVVDWSGRSTLQSGRGDLTLTDQSSRRARTSGAAWYRLTVFLRLLSCVACCVVWYIILYKRTPPLHVSVSIRENVRERRRSCTTLQRTVKICT